MIGEFDTSFTEFQYQSQNLRSCIEKKPHDQNITIQFPTCISNDIN